MVSELIVTCVHGTWARKQRWPQLEQAITGAVPASIRYFEWSGRNSLAARTRAALALRQSLREEVSRNPAARHLLIAHSHGANIVLHALDGADSHVREAIAGIALLSPELLTCERVDDPRYVARLVFLGTCVWLALLWLLMMAIGPASSVAWLALAVASIAALAWVTPWRVCRRAGVLVERLTQPVIDVPGLIIRAPADEATTTLASAAMAGRWTRHLQATFLRPRGFSDRESRQLREADTFLNAFMAFMAVLALPLMVFSIAIGLVVLLHAHQWLIALGLGLIELYLLVDTGAIIVGSLYLAPLVVGCAFVLWPFGIWPTAAAVLLSVSLDSAPTSRWTVFELPARGLFRLRGWQHSTPANPAAIAAVADYTRDIMSSREKSAFFAGT